MTKVLIIGAAGRMGQALVRCVGRDPEIDLIAAVEEGNSPAIGKDAGVLAGIETTGVLVGSSLAENIDDVDVLIDFTLHRAVPAHVAAAAERGKAMVIGTTGFTTEEKAAVAAAAKQVPIVLAPNMSLGINMLLPIIQKASSVLGLDYDVEIVETHHKFKKDAPSGTALRLGEKVAEGRGQTFKNVMVPGRDGITGERPRGEIGIHALRMSDVIGEHVVSFAREGERIEFTHKATSRDAFAMGSMHAAKWLSGKESGLYDMQDVLGV